MNTISIRNKTTRWHSFVCIIYTQLSCCAASKKNHQKRLSWAKKNGSGTPNSTDNTVVLKKTENRSRKHKRKTWCCWIKTTLSVVYSGHCFLLSAIFKAQRCADSIKLQNENHTILFILELFFCSVLINTQGPCARWKVGAPHTDCWNIKWFSIAAL